MKPIKNAIRSALNTIGLGGIAQIYAQSALTDLGWFRSFKTKQSVDANGEPLPWCTYPFIEFIEHRLTKQMNVFEYGSGNSTRWYAARVGNIKAVEHDKSWFELVKNQLPANASVVYQDVQNIENYTGEVAKAGQQYHVVIVDGRQRVRCVEQAVQNLTPDGVIVFDNPERENYQSAHDLLKERGFRRIDFWGFAPVTAHHNCTAVFYRDNNCLGI